MKKMIALVLALMFILTSVSAFADSRRYDKYTNDAFGYSVEYPASWLVLDADMVALLTAVSDIGSEIDGLTTEEISNAAANKNIVTFMPMDDGYSNFSVDVNDFGMYLPASLLAALLCPEVVNQMKTYLPALKVIDSGSVVTVNGKDYAHLHMEYVLDGDHLHSEQYYIMDDTDLISITVTAEDSEYGFMSEIVNHALETLKF